MMNFIDERVRFFDVYESIFINIKNIIISIFIFMIKRLNYDFFLNRFFQRIIYINIVNMNDNSLKMMLHLLNDEKRMNFLKMLAEYINNKDKKSVFIFEILNI